MSNSNWDLNDAIDNIRKVCNEAVEKAYKEGEKNAVAGSYNDGFYDGIRASEARGKKLNRQFIEWYPYPEVKPIENWLKPVVNKIQDKDEFPRYMITTGDGEVLIAAFELPWAVDDDEGYREFEGAFVEPETFEEYVVVAWAEIPAPYKEAE